MYNSVARPNGKKGSRKLLIVSSIRYTKFCRGQECAWVGCSAFRDLAGSRGEGGAGVWGSNIRIKAKLKKNYNVETVEKRQSYVHSLVKYSREFYCTLIF